MTTICLVRHGETDWNRSRRLQGQRDTDLNATGREQARRAGLYLRQWPWDTVITTPLRRARDSAAIIAALLQPPIGTLHEMPHLMERAFGDAEGLTAEARRQKYPDGNVPGMESMEQLRERSMHGLGIVAERHVGERILLVSHGGVINSILAGVSGDRIGTGKTRLQNASLSLLHHRNNEWEIEFYNVTEYLEAEKETVGL